jgi:hypothetical protein
MESQTGTEIHTSGFGAPPPGGGGFGPPPGGGGGGFGPPPGGGGGGFGPPQGGQPPGGFGPPQGGGGYGGPPQGGAPQGGYGPPMGGEPPKKSNTMMYVGIGCFALLFLSCLCGGGAWWWMQKKAAELQTDLQNYQPTPGTFGVVPPSGGTDSTGGSGAPAAGGTCAKAKACCEALYSQPIFQGQGMQACAAVDQVANTPFAETACTAQLNAFKQAAANIPGGVPAACN